MQEILELSVEDRILMIEKIWDSIDHENMPMLDAHKAELDRRLERYQKGETSFVSWDAIKRELNAAK